MMPKYVRSVRMTGVVELANDLIRGYRVAIAEVKDLITPEEFQMTLWALEAIEVADYYEISADIAIYVHQEIATQYYDQKTTEIRLSLDCRPPSNVCLMRVEGATANFEDGQSEPMGTMFRRRFEDSREGYDVFGLASKASPKPMGSFRISKDGKGFELFGPEANMTVEQQQVTTAHMISASCIFNLINQPRFVVQSKAGSRQQRKAMKRAHNISVDAWHKIEWNIKEPVKSKEDIDKGGWRMPLHYTRGHWRTAQDHWDDVVIRKDGKPYKWIEGFWSGHPAYGVKKSYHAPKLGKNYENV
jgi:hypothetical protein